MNTYSFPFFSNVIRKNEPSQFQKTVKSAVVGAKEELMRLQRNTDDIQAALKRHTSRLVISLAQRNIGKLNGVVAIFVMCIRCFGTSRFT